MKLNIYAGKRVLYKHDGQWEVGVLEENTFTAINTKGLYLRIIPKDFINFPADEIPYVHIAEINDIFLDAEPIEDWMRDYGNLMTKEKYIEFTQSEDFNHAIENAYVSDGEYSYYPVSKYNKGWLEKQPFNYVVRST